MNVRKRMKSSKIWETQEYHDAVEHIRERLRTKIGKDFPLIYEAFDFDEHGMPVDNIGQVAIEGTVVVEDDIHDNYIGTPIKNPRWIDLVREGIKQMDANGDYHHVFFTGFYEVSTEPTDPLRIALDFES